MSGYFWLSLNYSLVSLAFLVSFNRALGKGGFVVYWMANWITMSALGYVMETVFLWLGPMFFPFFLLFWVIINVCNQDMVGTLKNTADARRYRSLSWISRIWQRSTVMAT